MANELEECVYCDHLREYHDGGKYYCHISGCKCKVFGAYGQPQMKNKEDEMKEPQFDTNKSLATKGAMRGAASYGSVPAGVLNDGEPANVAAVRGSKDEAKNSTFRFTDTKGEVLDITAVEEANAWEQLSGKFGVPVDELKGYGFKLEIYNAMGDKVHPCPDCLHVLDDPMKLRHSFGENRNVEVSHKERGGMVHANVHVDKENMGAYCGAY